MKRRNPTGNPTGRPTVLSEPVTGTVTVRVTQRMKEAWENDEQFRNKIRLYWEDEAKKQLE